MNNYEVNNKGLSIITRYEGCRLQAYKCPAGKWTIGYGHTDGVYEGMKITHKLAEAFLKKDVESACKIIKNSCTVELNVNQFSALASFIFNIGGTKFKQSKLLKYINQGKLNDAMYEFYKWDKANGKSLLGLRLRRMDEALLFTEGV